MTSIRPRRSVLYVPGTNEKALAKCGSLECDSVIFDLEDAVAPSAKASARDALTAYFSANPGSAMERIIRVNAGSTEWGADDLEAAIASGPDAILLPKVERPEDIAEAARKLDRHGADAIRLWAMIETPLGIVNIRDIARLGTEPSVRLDCFVVGSNDLCKETGLPIPEGRPTLLHWLAQVVLHARAFGIDVVDGVYNDFRDQSGYEAECRAGALLGFDGKTLIHPAQIAFANSAFGPTASAIAEAERIVAAFADQDNRDKGVIALDGKMVERLHLEMARKTLAKAGAART